MINRSVQCFVTDTRGAEAWETLCTRAGLAHNNFEPMLSYLDAETEAVIDAACIDSGKARAVFLEDLGTYLVSHARMEAVRRILRFGGETFSEFIVSLDELQGRTRLALPDLDLPEIEVTDHGEGRFSVDIRAPHPGFGAVAVGLLRAMADDYGALALIEAEGAHGAETERVGVVELAADFASGRTFSLGAST